MSDVLAEIKFYLHGRLVLSVSPGRWGDTEQPAVRKARDPFASLFDLNAIPFRIGEQHELNVVFGIAAKRRFRASTMTPTTIRTGTTRCLGCRRLNTKSQYDCLAGTSMTSSGSY